MSNLTVFIVESVFETVICQICQNVPIKGPTYRDGIKDICLLGLSFHIKKSEIATYSNDMYRGGRFIFTR